MNDDEIVDPLPCRLVSGYSGRDGQRFEHLRLQTSTNQNEAEGDQLFASFL